MYKRVVIFLLLAFFLGTFFVLDDLAKDGRFYVFSPEALYKIAQKHIKENPSNFTRLLDNLVNDLGKTYPKHISLNKEWIFNNAGGAMGSMIVLHGSITEYLIIFGTPIGTEGHTGRFLADDYFIILDGEQWGYAPGDTDRMAFKPGDMHHLPRGKAEGYKMPERCWALEYARGWIPPMLPFGFADMLFSTLDYVNLINTVRIYAELVVGQLLIGKF